MQDAGTALSASSSVERYVLTKTDELVSLYDQTFHLVGCSPRHTETYGAAASLNTTLWEVYPQLFARKPAAAVGVGR